MNLKIDPIARSQAIAKTWKNLDWPSVFSAIIYPAIGVFGLLASVAVGLAFSGVTLQWWYAPIVVATVGLSVFMCSMGIGPLHRIWQHRAGELRTPAQFIVALNCVLAMQGKVKDWVNYHSQHHRLSDRPGDPHNPFESKFWAWIGWILWRDKKDLARPVAGWLKDNWAVQLHDSHYIKLSLLFHLLIPAATYLMVWIFGGPLILVALLHSAVIIGRGLHFHATTLGVNVAGHLNAPKWFIWVLAFLTGGEAFHEHHHTEPVSILHRRRDGFINRLVDYNGTMLLLAQKLGLARNFKIAPEFA